MRVVFSLRRDLDDFGYRRDAVAIYKEQHVMARGSQVRCRGGDICPGGLRELQVVETLILIERMGYGTQPNPCHLANIRGIRCGDRENLSIPYAGRPRCDGWPSAFE